MIAATHQRSGAVSRKPASGFLAAEPATRARQTASLSVGTHQENAVFYRGVTLGYSVAPNSGLDPYSIGGISAKANGATGPDYADIKDIPGEPIYSGFSSMDAAGTAMSIVAKRMTNADPNSLEYGGAIFSYVDNGVTLYGVASPQAGGLPYTLNGQTYEPAAPISSAGDPPGSYFLGGYHSHPNGDTFSDDGNGIGDIPSVLRVSTQANRPISLYLGRDGGFWGNQITVEVATGYYQSNAWTVITRGLGSYP